ncbi:hypothetical protein CASFOL_015769 [Castilleja foliolosa]|uniref:Uncharacterized protein n=1 Tax=Castilleja foliolosa TaxID=1961234 RepID=A0ABD3DGR1_9LAMI
MDSRDSQEELWDRISRDDYIKYVVGIEFQELCLFSVIFIFTATLDYEGKKCFRVTRIYEDIRGSIVNRSIHVDCQLNKLALVIQKVTALLIEQEDLIVRMRTAALPTFRKLYGRIETDLEAKEKITVTIQNNYNTYSFNGEKKLVISTATWIGGKNDFLGRMYMTVGGASLCFAILFALLFIIKPRGFGGSELPVLEHKSNYEMINFWTFTSDVKFSYIVYILNLFDQFSQGAKLTNASLKRANI